MSTAVPRAYDRLWAVLRAVRVPCVVLGCYFGLRAVFAALSQDDGLIAPSGVHLGVALLGALVLALRLTALFVVPGWIGYRAIGAALRPRRPDVEP